MALTSPSPSAALRGARRYRRMRAAVATSMISKVVRLGSQTVVVAIAIQHLGASTYGMWVTAVTALGWLSWGQMGLAPSLANALAAAEGEDRAEDQGVYFTTALGLVAIICLLLFVIGLTFSNFGADLMSPLVGPNIYAQPAAEHQWHSLLQAAFVLGLLRLPLGLIESAFVGLQSIHVLRVFEILGQLFGLMAAVILAAGAASSALYMLSVTVALECGAIGAALYLISIMRPNLRPSWAKFQPSKVRAMFSLGAGYFVVQITSYVVSSVGTLVLAAFHGPVAVLPYALTWQLYNMAAGVWMMFITALWGGFGEARVRGDWDWIFQTARRLILFTTLASTMFAFGLVVAGAWVLDFWSGGQIKADPIFLLWVATYTIAFSWTVVHAQILSALDQIWSQLGASCANAVLVVVLSICLAPKFGVVGLAVALLLACGLTTAWAFPVMLRRRRPNNLCRD